MTSTLAKGFTCGGCVGVVQGIVELDKELSFYDKVEFVKSLCFLGYKFNGSVPDETMVTAGTRKT